MRKLVIVALALALSPTALLAQDPVGDRLSRIEQSLAARDAKIAQIDAKVDALNAKVDALASYLTQAPVAAHATTVMAPTSTAAAVMNGPGMGMAAAMSSGSCGSCGSRKVVFRARQR